MCACVHLCVSVPHRICSEVIYGGSRDRIWKCVELLQLSVTEGIPHTASVSINCLMRWLSASPRFISVLFDRVIHGEKCPTLREETQPSDHCLCQHDGSDKTVVFFLLSNGDIIRYYKYLLCLFWDSFAI